MNDKNTDNQNIPEIDVPPLNKNTKEILPSKNLSKAQMDHDIRRAKIDMAKNIFYICIAIYIIITGVNIGFEIYSKSVSLSTASFSELLKSIILLVLGYIFGNNDKS